MFLQPNWRKRYGQATWRLALHLWPFPTI